MNYGGPVWHLSVAPLFGERLSEKELKRLAYRHLAGVGDMGREFHEFTGRAYHLRRRLTEQEQTVTGPAVDLRGTEEALSRLAAVKDMLPRAGVLLAAEELGIQPSEVMRR